MNVLKKYNGMKEAIKYLDNRQVCMIQYKDVNLRKMSTTTNNNNMKCIYIVLNYQSFQTAIIVSR